MAVFKIEKIAAPADAMTALRDRWDRLGRQNRAGPAVSPRLLRLIELGLVVLIGVLLAGIFWTVFGPVVRPPSAPPAIAPVEAVSDTGALDPFQMAAPVAAPSEGALGLGPDLSETTLNLALHGTWTTPDGGAAFIKTPDEKQGRYGIGDTITSGVTLESIYLDQVVIRRGGVRESLRLINRKPTDAPAQQSAAAGAGAETDAEPAYEGLGEIGDFVAAQPELDQVGNVRLVLKPAGDAKRFAAAGLQDGDALIAIEGQQIEGDPQRAAELLSGLGGKPRVTISIERDGVIMPILVDLAGAGRKQ